MQNAPSQYTSLPKILSVILPLLWRNKSTKIKLSIGLTLLFLMLTIVLNLSVPILFKYIVNQLSGEMSSVPAQTVLLLVAYGICWTASRFFVKIQEMTFFRPLCSAITDYSLEVFNHIHALSLKFHLARETGKVASSIERSQFAIPFIVTDLLFRVGAVLIETLLALVVLWHFYGSEIGFIVIGILIAYFIVNYILIGFYKKATNDYDAIEVMVDKYVVETLINSENIKYMAAERFELSRADRLLRFREDAIVNLFWFGTLMTVMQAIVLGCGLTLISYIIGQRVLNGSLQLGDFVLVNGYLLVLFNPLEQIAGFLRSIVSATGMLEHSLKVLKESCIISESKEATELKIKEATVEFENVDFSYLENKKIINQLSLKIPSKSTVAIVGTSGSGKSTLSRLLFRFYDINGGKILIDGQDIKQVTLSSLHQQIAVVPQDIVLLNKSLKYNICYGNFDVSESDIEKVIQEVHLDKLMAKLPDGLETIVGERGVKLSGGEKQRIAIARALLKKPKILVFDEATSSLDTKTERIIQKNIYEITKTITTLLIAHRLSTVVNADIIVVIDKGAIVEQGTHAQLLALNGFYARLWEQQYAKK